MDLRSLRSTILSTFPELEDASFTALSEGWDSFAVDVDGRLIFKFPRHAAAEARLVGEARLLTVIRPRISLAVPELSLHEGPPLFSRHAKIPGDHLVTAAYERLSAEARDRLGTELGEFYAELHSLESETMKQAGAGPVDRWLPPEEIIRRASSALPPGLCRYAEEAVAAWQELPPDPYGLTFGLFDGHGWNMAFDHERGRLNGVYDFGDAGFGPVHQEFIYSNFVSPELTDRIVEVYESVTGRRLDRERIDLLTGILRLSELAEYGNDPVLRPRLIEFVAEWAELRTLP